MKIEIDADQRLLTVAGRRFTYEWFEGLKEGERFQVVKIDGEKYTLLNLTPPKSDYGRPLSAYDFGNVGPNNQSLPFAIDRERSAWALRRLADRIEVGTVTVNAVHIETIASADDFGVTELRLKLHELLPP